MPGHVSAFVVNLNGMVKCCNVAIVRRGMPRLIYK